jgi:peptidoglycan L-alanyl-D-glutamate endopeptidase CwlK
VRAFEHIKRAYKAGYQVQVIQALRTIEEQEALYAQGRTVPGQVVTWVKRSYHNFGLAYDLGILTDDGTDIIWEDDAGYTALGQIGKSLGLGWGGDWKQTPDMPHYEFTFGLSINDLCNGVKIPDVAIPNYDEKRKKPMEQWLKDALIQSIKELGAKGKVGDPTLWINKVNNDEDVAPLAIILLNRMQ